MKDNLKIENCFNDTDKKYVSILLDVMQEKGVKHVVCSPGSRNTPLILGVASREDFHKHIVIDERSAAFVALGISSVSREPVILVCTSGTAILNYAPAVAEAFYQGVPLIILSADRPTQWIDQDDSQTIRQSGCLTNFVKKSFDLPSSEIYDNEREWFVNRIANEALIDAMSGKPGPVHINVPLSEPLGGKKVIDHIHQRTIDYLEADTIGNKEIIRNLASRLMNSKVMFVAGFMPPDERLHKSVAEFAKLPNVALMCETLSNLHVGSEPHKIDTVLTAFDEKELDAYAPDLIISVGGSLVSRKLKEYLRRNSSHIRHWSVGFQNTFADCFMGMSLRVASLPSRFLHELYKYAVKIKPDAGVEKYKKQWHDLRLKANRVKKEFVDGCQWSEIRAFDLILKNLPERCNLFLSNGTTVRYAQILSEKLPHASYCNRGVSGIEGSVSTSIGGAMVYKGKTVLITGDLSMSYDMGALAIYEAPDSIKIIMIDNGGGGIFRFIPTTSSLDEREEYFCVPNPFPIKNLAEGFGWRFFDVESEKTLIPKLQEFLGCGEKSILRVKCDGKISASLLRKYMNVKYK